MTPNQTPATRASMPPPRNSNGNPQAEPQALPEHRQKMVEAANAAYQQVLAERDELARKLHEVNLRIEAMTVQLESLKGVVSMMESAYLQTKMESENRISTYQSQRDEAVTRFASLEATLANIYVIVRNTINEPPQGESDADHN